MCNFLQVQGNQRHCAEAYSCTPHKRFRRLTPKLRKRAIYGWKLIRWRIIPPVIRAHSCYGSHFDRRCIPSGCVAKNSESKHIPAFSCVASRASRCPRFRFFRRPHYRPTDHPERTAVTMLLIAAGLVHVSILQPLAIKNRSFPPSRSPSCT